MKEYIFENQLNSNIRIVIKAYTLIVANEILNIEVKNPQDYKKI
jgi:hypothetical protein